MKKYLTSILVVIAVFSVAQAQNTTSQDSKTWFGTSASLHYVIPTVDVHIGFEDAFGDNIDLRTTLSGIYVSGGGFLGANINGIVNLSDGNSGTKGYLGFGPRAALTNGGAQDTGIFVLGLGGLWGAEFFTENSTRPFIELDASVPLNTNGEIVPIIFPILTVTTGVNFRF